MAKISIVVPVYNLSKYLEDFILSLLDQTFRDFEVILVNDGSTDNSLMICEKYSKIDSRIKIIDKHNEGAGPTRNVGLDNSCGEYIMFLDGDDIVDSNMLEILYREVTSDNYDLIICNFNISYRDGSVEEFIKDLKEYCIMDIDSCRKSYFTLLCNGLINHTWNKLYKRELIIKNKLEFPDLRRSQDAIFNCDYFNYVNKYKLIKTPLYNYRANDIQKEWKKFPKDYFDISVTLNNHYKITFENWGIMNNDIRQFLSNYLINDVNMCMRFSFSPNWKFSKKQRLDYCKRIVSSSEVEYAMKYANPGTIYKKIMFILMKKKKYSSILFIAYTSIFLKEKFNYIYKLLK